MKFLKTFENYDPTLDIEETESDETNPMEEYPEGEDVMPEGIEPLGESNNSKLMRDKGKKNKTRAEIIREQIKRKANAVRRRRLLISKPQD